jgi:hypothetical protein
MTGRGRAGPQGLWSDSVVDGRVVPSGGCFFNVGSTLWPAFSLVGETSHQV